MSETEEKPLLVQCETTEVEDIPLHPPPPYRPVASEERQSVITAVAEPSPPPPPPLKYSQAMPLPTYAQSEKYEAEGVLDFHQKDTEGEETDDEAPRHSQDTVGTWCEFTLFFFVCATLSVVGFVFSMCVATTVAAQGGAVAGLGIALVSKPIMFEMYDDSFVRNFCASDVSEGCFNRFYTVVRFCVWIIGLFGLFLFYRGTAAFLKARQATH